MNDYLLNVKTIKIDMFRNIDYFQNESVFPYTDFMIPCLAKAIPFKFKKNTNPLP